MGMSKKTVQDLLLAGHQPRVLPLSNLAGPRPCAPAGAGLGVRGGGLHGRCGDLRLLPRARRGCVCPGEPLRLQQTLHTRCGASDSAWKSDGFDLLLLSLGSHPPASQIPMRCWGG